MDMMNNFKPLQELTVAEVVAYALANDGSTFGLQYKLDGGMTWHNSEPCSILFHFIHIGVKYRVAPEQLLDKDDVYTTWTEGMEIFVRDAPYEFWQPAIFQNYHPRNTYKFSVVVDDRLHQNYRCAKPSTPELKKAFELLMSES